MARRIAAAILLTVWAILVAGGLATYWVTRSVLVGDLDATLTLRARVVADAAARGERPERAAAADVAAAQDRYVVHNGLKQPIVRVADAEPDDPPAPPQSASFSRLGDGRLMRTVSVTVAAPDAPGGSVTVAYSGPADRVGRVLSRLAATLTACGLAAGAAAAAVAVAVARAALRPLNDAADAIGQIDERRIDRRIDAGSLPPELRPAVARLNDMLARLENAFAQRKQFLADASHELRTPVAALVTTMEVALRRRRDADELTRTLETCLHDARHLKRLVHVLMEHARGEASASAAHAERPEAVDAAELLGECADLAAALGVPKGVRVERALPQSMPFVTQPQRLRSVVTNLLSNAIEYNRPGGRVRLEARLADGALEVTVSDTGRGIAAEHLPHLFEPFYRADESRRGTPAAAEGGETPHMGLGLFLVDSHLKALGGRCTVESEVGVGTAIHVTVPAAAPGAVTPAVTGVTTGPAAPPATASWQGGAGTSQNKSPAAAVLENAVKSR
jgi:signal transduction histidine kinase